MKISRCESMFLVVLLLVTGCVSATDINIKSVPAGATVYLRNPANGRTTKLGRTPTVYRSRSSTAPQSLVFELDGYVPREVLVATPYSAQANIAVTLSAYSTPWFQTLLRTDMSKEVDSILSQLYDLPIELEQKSESEAERMIKTLRENFDNLALFHSIVGQYYYKKKDAKKAKIHFSRVLKIKPEDVEATNMLKLIESL